MRIKIRELERNSKIKIEKRKEKKSRTKQKENKQKRNYRRAVKDQQTKAKDMRK